MYQPLYEESLEYEDGTFASIEQMSADVTAFLAWSAEPEMEERKRLGFIVMSFLIIFVLFYCLYLKIENKLIKNFILIGSSMGAWIALNQFNYFFCCTSIYAKLNQLRHCIYRKR